VVLDQHQLALVPESQGRPPLLETGKEQTATHQQTEHHSRQGPEHHPDPAQEAPCKDQEATWVNEPLLTVPMVPNLDPTVR